MSTPTTHRRLLRFAAFTVSLLSGCDSTAPGAAGACSAETIQLQSGASVRLESDTLLCFVLPANSGQYALSYFDSRPLDRSRTGSETLRFDEPGFGLKVVASTEGLPEIPVFANAGLRSQASGRIAADVGALGSHVCPASVPRSPFCHAKAWTAGDTIDIPMTATTSLTAVVFAVVGDIALAVDVLYAPNLSAAAADAYRESAAELQQSLYPLLATTFSSVTPRTSLLSPGMLAVLSPSFFPTADIRYGTEAALVMVMLTPTSNATHGAQVFQVMAHEFTHAWQAQFEWDRGWREPSGAGWPTWGAEGSADLLAIEALQRAANADPAGNYDGNAGTDPWLSQYLFWVKQGGVVLAPTFGNAAYLLQRHFVRGLVARGVAYEVALREVSRGALEGWHGINDSEGQHQGLVSRIQNGLGLAWDPIAVTLDWPLTAALDDRTTAGSFGDASVKDRWRGWSAAANVVADNSVRDAGVFVGGSAHYVILTAGSSATHVVVRANTQGLHYQLARF